MNIWLSTIIFGYCSPLNIVIHILIKYTATYVKIFCPCYCCMMNYFLNLTSSNYSFYFGSDFINGSIDSILCYEFPKLLQSDIDWDCRYGELFWCWESGCHILVSSGWESQGVQIVQIFYIKTTSSKVSSQRTCWEFVRLQVLSLYTVAEVNCKQLSKFNKKGSKLDFLTSIYVKESANMFYNFITMLSICFFKSCKYIFFILFYFPLFGHIICLSIKIWKLLEE